MTHFVAVAAFDFAPILWFRAIAREMTLLLTVAASNVIRIARLITLLSYMVLRPTVATGPRGACFDIGTL